MVRSQKGFTIIELVVVIVILGILAAVAFPKFQDLSGDAKTAVVNGGKAALQSQAVISYAKASGVKQNLATITGNVQTTGLTFGGGTCTAATIVYAADTTVSASVDISEYCSG
jgi:MSHA pilin protein MshA